MRFRRIESGTVAALALAFTLAGCVVEGPDPVVPSGRPPTSLGPGTSGSIEPSVPAATPTATPTPTLIPPIEERGPGFEQPASLPPVEVDPDVRTATTEVDGVRITIEVARNPLVAGQAAWITTTLRNTGRDTIGWVTDGCSIHVGAHGEMPFRWASGFVQSGTAKTFKDWAYVANLPPRDSPVWLRAVAEPFVGRGAFGCADLGVPHELKAGLQIRERHRWDGQAAGELGLPPSGTAEWIGEFRSWWRASDPGAEFGEMTRESVVVRLPVEIVRGRDPRLLSAGQAIDAAMVAPQLRALLDANPSIQDWMPITTRFDVHSNLWQIGLRTEDGFGVVVHIEPLTGAVLEVTSTP